MQSAGLFNRMSACCLGWGQKDAVAAETRAATVVPHVENVLFKILSGFLWCRIHTSCLKNMHGSHAMYHWMRGRHSSNHSSLNSVIFIIGFASSQHIQHSFSIPWRLVPMPLLGKPCTITWLERSNVPQCIKTQKQRPKGAEIPAGDCVI